MTRHTLTISVHKAIWLTANQRLHWSTRMRRTRMLRAYAASEARITGAAGKQLGASTVTAVIGYPTSTRADPANAAPTVKAIIDGLVDAASGTTTTTRTSQASPSPATHKKPPKTRTP